MKASSFKICLAQINPVVGDLRYNLDKIIYNWREAAKNNAKIVIFPELAITGYNPQDLLLRKDFIQKANDALESIVKYSSKLNTACIVGGLDIEDNNLFNTAYFIHDGKILFKHRKLSLPNYGVFDEKRFFTEGNILNSFKWNNKNILLLICRDIWLFNDIEYLKNIDIIIIINGSPFTKSKYQARLDLLKNLLKKYPVTIIYLNMVGGQDSIVYDGGSFILNKDGSIHTELPFFQESCYIADLNSHALVDQPKYCQEELIYNALVLSLQDYYRKNNFKKIIIGLSGGIDSAISSVIAIDALGPENVLLVTLPSRYTSDNSKEDCKEFLQLINKTAINIDIDELFGLSLASLDMDDNSIDNVSQNLQARMRGVLLMALANKHNGLLLTTGNKSELAIGYATLYGDMNGGFNLLKDLYKTEVYKIANWRNGLRNNLRNRRGKAIPDSILTKAPSAELYPGQKDIDQLPSYDILDKILYDYIEEKKSVTDICNSKYNGKIINKDEIIRILNLVNKSQFKRNQSALGPKISDMSFDLDWRYPITNKFT